MNKPENGDTPPKNEFLTPGYCFGRIGLFIVCGLIVLLVYFVLMFPLQGVLGEWAEKAETEKNMENLKAVIQSCNHGLTEDEAEAVAKIVSNLKIKTNTKKGERPSSDICDDIFRYLW